MSDNIEVTEAHGLDMSDLNVQSFVNHIIEVMAAQTAFACRDARIIHEATVRGAFKNES